MGTADRIGSRVFLVSSDGPLRAKQADGGRASLLPLAVRLVFYREIYLYVKLMSSLKRTILHKNKVRLLSIEPTLWNPYPVPGTVSFLGIKDEQNPTLAAH